MKIALISLLVLLMALAAPAETRNKVKFEKKFKDPVLKQLDEAREQAQAKRDEETAAIHKRQDADKEKEKEAECDMSSDTTGVLPPPAPTAFRQAFHFPPQAQYATNTCWSFSTTSFYEAEIFRLTGKKIKLSEMYTVYWEYVEKVRRYVRERGESLVAEGGEGNALNRVWKQYGIVPAEAYSGLKNGADKHDHTLLIDEVKTFLDYVKTNKLWDEEEVIAQLRVILDKHIGAPPQRFVFNGREMTPQEFLQRETGLNLDDYVELMSTAAQPFYSWQEFKVPDNWWHSKEYLNVPLDVWYGIVVKAAKAGYTLAIGGDVSEPGKLGKMDICFIPTFDIPEAYIDQDSREYRIQNKTTDDDHGIHLVGYTNFKGKDWFLIKDSGRSARWGKFEGYYFFRGDYVKLKMLSYTVHKDMVREILAKVQ